MSSSLDAINRAYASLNIARFTDPAIGFLLNLLHRNAEHAEAAISALATPFGSAAEVVSRAAFEASINIIYIIGEDSEHRPGRLSAYFYHYLNEADRQVIQWKKQIATLLPEDQKIHLKASAQRQSVIESQRAMVARIPGFKEEKWPSAVQRFEAIGKVLDYRTLYVRLSSEAHADAEETLRYFFAKIHPDKTILEQMRLETATFSRFLVYAAIAMFVETCFSYASAYSLIKRFSRDRNRTRSGREETPGNCSPHRGRNLRPASDCALTRSTRISG